MYKNQLQELAQRSCLNLPSYSCIREGPDHAPRFKAKVNFSGEVFESPTFCSTLRQAEHTAAEVALKTLSIRGPSRVLAARVLDETGIYKNLLQETAHRAGLKLPVYTIVRSGPGHVPVFTCTIELGGMSFIGESARTKKQAQKSAAMTAWFALKELSWSGASSSPLSEFVQKNEQEQVTVARFLASLKSAETNKLILKGRCHGHLELASPRREVMSYQSCRSFYPMQSHSGAYSHFFPELAICKAHHQGIVSEQQSFVLSVPSAPTSVPGPQFFPFVRSFIRPDHCPQFSSRGREPLPLVPGISPFLCVSDGSMPIPVGSISQVTIEEVDENSQVEDEWLANNANSSGWNLNFPSNASGLSSTEVLNCADSLKLPNTGNSRRKEIHPKGEFNRIPPGFPHHRRTATSTGNEIFLPQKAMRSSFVQSNFESQSSPADGSPRMARDFAPPLPLAPVVVRNVEAPAPLLSALRPSRTAVSVGSTGPCWLGGAKNIGGMACATSMAPAVQIRTVVPVCSASPARKTPCPGQEGVSVFPNGGRKRAS